MILNTLSILTEIVLYFTIADWIINVSWNRKLYTKVTLIAICVGSSMLIEDMAIREELFVIICIIEILIYLYMSLHRNERVVNILIMTISTVSWEIIVTVFCALPTSLILYFSKQSIPDSNLRILIILERIGFTIFIVLGKKWIQLYKMYTNRGTKIILTVMGIFLLLIKHLGMYWSNKEEEYMSVCLGYFLIVGVIFWFAWLIDHYHLVMVRQKMEKDNAQMNAKLHRSKEIVPLLVSVVNQKDEMLDAELVDEFRKIYDEQMIEERGEHMNAALLGSTGVKMVDAQLQHYILECEKKGILMDVFVTGSIFFELRDLKIAQLKLHNLIGNLLRNAIRATEKSRAKGRILTIIGIKENGLEIDVFDSGTEIPKRVLDNFGIRGVTTGGTGNGLAEITEVLESVGASLIIKENRPGSGSYVKGFQVLFDGEGRRILNTYRKDKLHLKSKVFWTIQEDV